MKKRKNITDWHKSYFTKFAAMLLAASLILMVASCSRGAEVNKEKYPPPQNLYIAGFTGTGADRVVSLAWEAIDTENTVTQYVVYRNGDDIERTANTKYQNVIGNSDYDFYITAIYEGEIESNPSNTVNTGNTGDISAVGPGPDKEEELQESDEDPSLSGDDKEEVDNGSESGENQGLEGDDEEDTDKKSSSGYTMISGPCGNPYYPVAEGISHTYKSSSGTITSTITSVHDAGFTVTHNVAGSTQIHEWECSPEGLVDLSNPASEALKVISAGAIITGTSSVTGVTIPGSISVGDAWTQTYSGTLTVEGYETDLDFTATVNYTAVNTETITVSAGTFKAIRVDSKLNSDYTLKTHGVSMPLYTYNGTSSAWFVEGVGSVKSTTHHIIKGTGAVKLSEEFTSTMELTEYSLP